MKIRFLCLLIFGILMWWYGDSVEASCHKIDMGEGRSFCWEVRKSAEGFYHAETSDMRGDLSKLSCTLELGNAGTVNLDQCRGDFRYEWGNQRYELTANLPDHYFVLVNTFDFVDMNKSNVTLQYANYQPEFMDVSTSRVKKDEYVDFSIRVRSTWLEKEYFDGTIGLSVEEWRNGKWRIADTSDYRLERSDFSFSRYERGEKNLNGIVRFYQEGEFRIVAKIKGTDAWAWQRFYVNDDYTRDYYSHRRDRSDRTEYTTNERRKLRAVYSIWPEVIRKLEDDYPRLRNSWTRKSESNVFYRNMEKVLDGERYPVFSSWSVFYRSFWDWLSMTIRLR